MPATSNDVAPIHTDEVNAAIDAVAGYANPADAGVYGGVTGRALATVHKLGRGTE
jgi:hypothetical protein